MSPNPLRNLPSVHEVLENPTVKALVQRINRSAVMSTVRTVLDEVRHEVQTIATDRTLPSVSDLAERIARRIAESQQPVRRAVVNATGKLLGGEWGQAPLAEEALADIAAITRDYTLCDSHATRPTAIAEKLLCELTGAEAALIFHSQAAALPAALAALASEREILVSRSQVVEIGRSRLPDLAAVASTVLREVGTANKTRLSDYAEALGPKTAALLSIESGDFAGIGNIESVALDQLVQLGREHQIPVIQSLGLATLCDLQTFGLPPDPRVNDSIQQGTDLVFFSGDGLIGGPECGILLGRQALLEKIERHTLAQTASINRLALAALTATLCLYRDPEKAQLGIPLLRLLATSVENLKGRAERLAPQAAALSAVAEAEAISDVSQLGWGATPRQLPTWCVSLRPATMPADRFAAALRNNAPSVVGVVRGEQLVLDLRSVSARQDVLILRALEAMSPPETTEYVDSTNPENPL